VTYGLPGLCRMRVPRCRCLLLFAIRLAYRQPVYKRQDRGKWQARIVGANGRAVAKLFDRKADAVRWEAEQFAARDRGDWIDPRDGKVAFAEFYADWSARQVWESTTTLAMNLAVGQATFAAVPIGRIRRSHIEAWVKTMASADLAPGTIKTATTTLEQSSERLSATGSSPRSDRGRDTPPPAPP
jgi:hypothetical protein